MRKLVDGFLSLLAAIALGGVGIIMTLAFLRKALSGVSPSRDRTRR